MDYELRIIPECPNSAPALALFRQALAAENVDEGVRIVQLDSDAQAEALHFRGSPSFIADGHDLFPSTASPALTAGSTYALTATPGCRRRRMSRPHCALQLAT